MAISLFQYNEEACCAALALLSETGKAAVIHPTGTGKTFIVPFPYKTSERYNPENCISEQRGKEGKIYPSERLEHLNSIEMIWSKRTTRKESRNAASVISREVR